MAENDGTVQTNRRPTNTGGRIRDDERGTPPRIRQVRTLSPTQVRRLEELATKFNGLYTYTRPIPVNPQQLETNYHGFESLIINFGNFAEIPLERLAQGIMRADTYLALLRVRGENIIDFIRTQRQIETRQRSVRIINPDEILRLYADVQTLCNSFRSIPEIHNRYESLRQGVETQMSQAAQRREIAQQRGYIGEGANRITLNEVVGDYRVTRIGANNIITITHITNRTQTEISPDNLRINRAIIQSTQGARGASAFYREVGDWTRGLIIGDFGNEQSGSQAIASIAIGVIPGLGQLADIRDLSANIYRICFRGEHNSPERWFSFGLSVVAIVPGVGDTIKVIGRKAIDFSTAAGRTTAQLSPRAIEFIREFIQNSSRLFNSSNVVERLQEILTQINNNWNAWKRTIIGLWERVVEIISIISTNVQRLRRQYMERLNNALDELKIKILYFIERVKNEAIRLYREEGGTFNPNRLLPRWRNTDLISLRSRKVTNEAIRESRVGRIGHSNGFNVLLIPEDDRDWRQLLLPPYSWTQHEIDSLKNTIRDAQRNDGLNLNRNPDLLMDNKIWDIVTQGRRDDHIRGFSIALQTAADKCNGLQSKRIIIDLKDYTNLNTHDQLTALINDSLPRFFESGQNLSSFEELAVCFNKQIIKIFHKGMVRPRILYN